MKSVFPISVWLFMCAFNSLGLSLCVAGIGMYRLQIMCVNWGVLVVTVLIGIPLLMWVGVGCFCLFYVCCHHTCQIFVF